MVVAMLFQTWECWRDGLAVLQKKSKLFSVIYGETNDAWWLLGQCRDELGDLIRHVYLDGNLGITEGFNQPFCGQDRLSLDV